MSIASLVHFETFVVIVVLLVGMVIVLVYLPLRSSEKMCPVGQEAELQNVWAKVEEVKLKPGYEVIYFKVKNCAEKIRCDGRKIWVKYKDENEKQYPKDKEWSVVWNCPSDLTPKTYVLRVYADRIEVL